MKRFHKAFVFLLIAALVLSLCSCAEKVKPEKIDTKNFSREIRVESSGNGPEIVHADKSAQSAQQGDTLKSDDGVRVGDGGELSLSADGDKYVYVEESSQLQLEASGTPELGKTRIVLKAGGVLLGTEEPLAEGELLEIQTDTITVSVPEGVVRAAKIQEKDASYTLIEVFEGEAQVTIRANGEASQLEAGEAALVQENGKKTRFILSDEIDEDFWRSVETTGLKVSSQGTGSKELSIPYGKLPAGVLRQLLEYVQNGHTLSVSRSTLTNLLETGHDYVETVVAEATCIQDGLLALECSLCGHREEQSIPAAGHIEETVPGVEAACSQTGVTEGVRCTVCGEILSGCEEIPALDHIPETVEAVEATCTESGFTAGTRCQLCGEVLSGCEEIPALGHTPVTDEAVEATCTEDGKTQGEHCSVCQEILIPQQRIPALGHEESAAADIAPTCTEAGLKGEVRCAVCGKVLKEEEAVAALGHQLEEIPAVEASCEKAGSTAGTKCSVCGEIITPPETVPALGHPCEIVPGKAASCTETGLTDGQKCTLCGKLVEPRKTIPMLEHQPETVPGKAPTCTKTGLTQGSRCVDCGEILVEQEEIPELGHTPIATPGREASCSSIGLTAGQRCQTCGKILLRQSVIPRLEHTPKKVRGLYATCFRDGYTESVVCEVCGYEIEPSQVIPALPHTRGGLSEVPATCTSTGLTEGLACRVCSYVMKAQEVVPKLPHTKKILPAVAATCTQDGLTEGAVCSVCGEVLTAQKKIPAGHQMTAGERSFNSAEPPLDASGHLNTGSGSAWCYSITHSCSQCSYSYPEYGNHVAGAAVTEPDGSDSYSVVRCTTCNQIISKVKMD